jgi:activator of HSP90 ATPase
VLEMAKSEIKIKTTSSLKRVSDKKRKGICYFEAKKDGL